MSDEGGYLWFGTSPAGMFNEVHIANGEHVSGTDPSFPSSAPEKKLDYIFGKSPTPLSVVSCSVVDNRPWASDHRPVVSRVSLGSPHTPNR